MKRSPIRARRPTPRRRRAPRQDQSWWETATLFLMARAGYRCELCREPFTGADTIERHHRLRRRDGGDRLSNLLLLHGRCHQWVTEHPTPSTTNGHIVRTGHDPATVPVWIDGNWWLLDDQGTRTPTEAP